jgi:hypothetical protein
MWRMATRLDNAVIERYVWSVSLSHLPIDPSKWPIVNVGKLKIQSVNASFASQTINSYTKFQELSYSKKFIKLYFGFLTLSDLK